MPKDRPMPIFSLVRYLPLALCAACAAALPFGASFGAPPALAIVPAVLAAVGIRDLIQKKHSVLRNYPIIGHLRYFLEHIRPEIRQYFIESDTENAPFSRSARNVVYQRSKMEADALAFGTKLDVGADGHEWIGHSMTPSRIASNDFRALVGAGRKKPYSISVFNISAMSFGALSANAIRALNLGAKKGGFAHDTGEGSFSKYHAEAGGDIIWEIGSGYFGCRTPDGRFDPEKFAATACIDQIKMIEIKLSQGAKPGHGGVLPASKVTPEIAQARGVPAGADCVSPASHSEFSDPKGLLDFIERLRGLSGGKPTGIKLCVGHPWEFMALVKAMLETGIAPDFVVVDGAEGGTGAAPIEFADHVGTPLQEGLLLVHNALTGAGLRDKVKIGASGKIISAFDIAKTIAMGADWCNSARGFMFAVGCIQAGACNTGKCPTGVATQDPVRQRALDPGDKSDRVARFHGSTLHALQELLQAAGLQSPSELRPWHIFKRVSQNRVLLLSDLFRYVKPNSLLDGSCDHPLFSRWWPNASADTFAPAISAYGAEHGQPAAGERQNSPGAL